jgi:hypothetical protein
MRQPRFRLRRSLYLRRPPHADIAPALARILNIQASGDSTGRAVGSIQVSKSTEA